MVAEGTACTGDMFGGAVKGLQPRQSPPSSALSSWELLNPLRRERRLEGPLALLGQELGTSPGSPWTPAPLSWDPRAGVSPLLSFTAHPRAPHGSERHSTAPGTGGFPAGRGVPGASQGRLRPRVVFASAEGRGGSALLSPRLPARGPRPLPRAPGGWGQWGARSRSRSGVRGKKQELNSH